MLPWFCDIFLTNTINQQSCTWFTDNSQNVETCFGCGSPDNYKTSHTNKFNSSKQPKTFSSFWMHRSNGIGRQRDNNCLIIDKIEPIKEEAHQLVGPAKGYATELLGLWNDWSINNCIGTSIKVMCGWQAVSVLHVVFFRRYPSSNLTKIFKNRQLRNAIFRIFKPFFKGQVRFSSSTCLSQNTLIVDWELPVI